VYGRAGGLPGFWFTGALERGAAPMVGDGANHWATVHADDCAELYALAAESGLRGELFNATDPTRFTVREMAEQASLAAGKKGVVAALSKEESEKLYGAALVKGLLLDQQVDSAKAARLLGWKPRFAGFCDDTPRYYDAWTAARAAK
jgi:nucleoside-diphosphate-sugar epimerase